MPPRLEIALYFSGYFKMSGTVSTPSMTALTVADAQVVTPVRVPKFSNSTVLPDGTITGNIWQLGIKEVSDRVYVGGSEHSLFGYQRSDFTRVSGSITKAGVTSRWSTRRTTPFTRAATAATGSTRTPTPGAASARRGLTRTR